MWPLGMVCIALAWVIYEEIDDLSKSEVLASADGLLSAQPVPLPSQAGFAMPDKVSLAVILERPVFSQTRRPSGAPGDGMPATSVDFALSGVVISGSERSALVRPGNGGIVQQLKEGEDIAGWTLVEIAPDRVIVRRDTVEAEVFLDYAAPAPPVPRTESRKEKPNAAPAPRQADERKMNATGDPKAGPDEAPEN